MQSLFVPVPVITMAVRQAVLINEALNPYLTDNRDAWEMQAGSSQTVPTDVAGIAKAATIQRKVHCSGHAGDRSPPVGELTSYRTVLAFYVQ